RRHNLALRPARYCPRPVVRQREISRRRILPPLIGEALFGCSFVFNESISVRIAWTIDPVQGRFDGGPQRGDGGVVASTFRIETGSQNKQRCRIDASVVQKEGHLT